MRSETRYLSQKHAFTITSEKKERVSNTTAQSETLRLSDFSEDGRESDSLCQVVRCSQYKRFFEQRVQQQEITRALHKKAINWLVTFCWTKNFTEQVLWYSVGYFYSYAYSRFIKKDRLTLILISAINLALKLFQPDLVMGFETLKSLLNNVWATNDFRIVEEEILQIFDFDLYYPTVLTYAMGKNTSTDLKAKILFIAQSLFMNSYESAINDIFLDDIICVALNPQTQNQVKKDIQELFKAPKFMDVIKQKYASKFNIDEFLRELLEAEITKLPTLLPY